MINYDSILSAFDGKPTLLQWLKMVKKALDESVLKDVTIAKEGDNIAFTFNFEDGTSVTTPKVTLPKGDKGDKGDTGATGPKGDAGVSITGIDTVSDRVVGDETLTTLRANYSDNTSDKFIVKAKNGKDGTDIYLHSVKLYDADNIVFFTLYSKKENLSLNDAIEYLPSVNPNMTLESSKMPVCFYSTSESYTKVGSLMAGKYFDGTNYFISVNGVVSNYSDNTVAYYVVNFMPTYIEDTLLGVNL